MSNKQIIWAIVRLVWTVLQGLTSLALNVTWQATLFQYIRHRVSQSMFHDVTLIFVVALLLESSGANQRSTSR